LKGETVFFGLVREEDYPQFIRKVIYLGLLQFFFQKEHQGTIAYLRVHGDFDFAIQNDYAGSERGWMEHIKLKDGDFLEFSEIMLRDNYTWSLLDPHDDGRGAKRHTIFVDFDIHRPEVRQKFYRKYNFEV